MLHVTVVLEFNAGEGEGGGEVKGKVTGKGTFCVNSLLDLGLSSS